ncbi:MAG: DUF2284 domain-containing protein [Desulfosalsimonadaceae bacterium]
MDEMIPGNPEPEKMEILRNLAVTHGASGARIICAADIPVDPRVRFKCMIPKCYMSGRCGRCPPYGYPLEKTKSILEQYKQAIFFHVRVESAIIAAKNLSSVITSGKADEAGNLFSLGGHYMLVYTLVRMVRKKAMEIGFHRTEGFSASNCKDILCFSEKTCQELNGSGECKNPEMSAPSMESAGIDAFRLAAKNGWQVFPIGAQCEPESVKRGMLMGLVLVA